VVCRSVVYHSAKRYKVMLDVSFFSWFSKHIFQKVRAPSSKLRRDIYFTFSITENLCSE
jgi:hypothetical protein